MKKHSLAGMLARNLQALAAVSPRLAERLCWPADDAHIPESGGRVCRRYRRALYPLETDSASLDRMLAPIDGSRGIFLFGLGLGEQLEALAQRHPSAPVLAWDRDPWLLRRLLSGEDYSGALKIGRLKLALGVDLVDLLPEIAGRQIVAHPLLSGIYVDEWRMVRDGLPARRALVCEGELFVDDFCQALQEEGYGIFRLDTQILSLEEMGETVRRFQPQFVAAVNYRSGLAELCRQHDTPLLCWEIDPAVESLQPFREPAEKCHVFVYRKAAVDAFREAGFAHVAYCPLAANPRRRRPEALSPADRERYGADVSFVGASMTAQKQQYLEAFFQQYQNYRQGRPEAAAEARALADGILAEQAADYTRFVIPALVAERCREFQAARAAAGCREDLGLLLGEIAAADKRLAYISALGPWGIRVWGDAGWQQAAAAGAVYCGPAGHFSELNKIYSASRINIDIGRLYQSDIATMRIFDILACGGFVLAEKNAVLEELFPTGLELETYATLEELRDKVKFYLARPEAAREFARRGRDAVLQRHTVAHRVRHMLAGMRQAQSISG